MTIDRFAMSDGFEYVGLSESYEPGPSRPLSNEELRDARRYFRFHTSNGRMGDRPNGRDD